MAGESQAGEKGEGTISFHYANKSTDANLSIDLGSTDVYLEMTGKAAAAMGADMAPEDRGAGKAPVERVPEEKRAAAPRPAQAEPGKDPREEREEEAKPEARKPAKPRPENGKYDPERLPEEPERAEADNGDVTAKVMSGIRRAQELFYRKRYPEALLAVRSSLEARPTAEGHALAGSIHYMKGEAGMARRQWMEALRLNPDMPAVVNMLERTRTPGGRGSPAPRPIQARPPAAAEPAVVPDDRVPFPEEYHPEDQPPQPRAVPAPAEPAPAQALPAAAPASAPLNAAPPAAPADAAPKESP